MPDGTESVAVEFSPLNPYGEKFLGPNVRALKGAGLWVNPFVGIFGVPREILVPAVKVPQRG